jgi:iron complex outermembrane recepter protein
MNSVNGDAPVTVASELSYQGRSSASLASILTGAASGFAMLVAMGGVAQAQTAAPAAAAADEEAEVIVVTGIRASLRNAANLKRNLAVISEVVTAEDIGKLPDTSIAESIARLPGLAAERVDGRATRISIRGLGPDFTTTLLNGREQVSTNDSRGIEFDQYPSELLGGVNVYKTADASLTAQGIAGTADLRTVRPLDRRERAFVVAGRVQSNSLGEVMPDVDANGYRGTMSYIDQFMDNRLGIALGVAHIYSPNFTNRTEAYDTGTTNARTTDGVGLGAGTRSPGGIKVMASSFELERTGVMGIIDFRPTDTLRFNIDAYHSTFESQQNNRGVEINLGQGANAGWVASTVQRNTDNYVTAGTFRGLVPVRNIYNQVEATVSAFGSRMDWDITEATKVSLDFGYSAAQRDTVFVETQPCFTDTAGACAQADINYSLRGDGGINLSIAGANLGDASRVRLADPYGWGADGFVKFPSVDDELFTYRLDFEHDLTEGAVDSVKFGVMYSDRRKERRFQEGFLNAPGATAPIPASAIAGTVDLGFGGLGQAIAFNPLQVLAAGTFTQNIPNEWWMGQNDWNVEEQVTTAYFQGVLDFSIAGMPTTGNFGLQYVQTEQSSDGFWVGYFFGDAIGSTGGVRAVQAGTSYGELLPSLNLSVEVSDNLYVRVGANRVLSRVNMEDMRITRQINFNVDNIDSTDPFRSPYTGDGGNPLLRPTISRNFDISIERYIPGGYISFAMWQKNLETYLRPGGDRYFLDLSGYPSPSWITDGAGNIRRPKIQTALVTTPGNAEGGTLKGLEFAASVPLNLVTESLEGFGVYFNVAKNFSDVEFADSRAGRTELPGFSDLTGNLAVYYERDGFQARVNASYRSSFLQDLVAYNAAIERRETEAATYVDAQIGYEFQEGSPLRGLSVQLQAQNVTGEPWVTYYSNPYRGLNYDEFGTTYILGASYKF